MTKNNRDNENFVEIDKVTLHDASLLEDRSPQSGIVRDQRSSDGVQLCLRQMGRSGIGCAVFKRGLE